MADITPTPGALTATAIRVPSVIPHKGGPALATFFIVGVSALANKTEIFQSSALQKAYRS